MNRDRRLVRLSEEHFDVVVVGGGILGAFLIHELSLRGLRTALLERADFASGTTSKSGKVLHGGLRYLQHLQFALTAESHREQSRIASLAPKLVRPLPFLVPSRKGKTTERLKLLGAAYGWRWLRPFLPGDDELPEPRFLGSEEVSVPTDGVQKDLMSGAMKFYDYQIRSPERLTIALICDASEHGASVANYVEVTGFDIQEGEVSGVQAVDRETGRQLSVQGQVIVNAAGPSAARMAASVDGSLQRTAFAKGVHVVLDRPEPQTALALPLPKQSSGSLLGDERRVFVMPWEGRTLVGATYAPYRDHPSEVAPYYDEVRDFLARLGDAWPELGLADTRPLYAYAGLYPIFGVDDAPDERFSASLRPRVVDHAEQNGPEGLISAVSVKLTGAWRLAEEVLERISTKVTVPAVSYPKNNRELSRATPTSLRSDQHNVWTRDKRLSGKQLSALVEEAVENEMARHVTDILLRRTCRGHFGLPDDETLRLIAEEMGRHLGWDDSTITAEVQKTRKIYRAVKPSSPDVSGADK